jgi:hypothetical protein
MHKSELFWFYNLEVPESEWMQSKLPVSRLLALKHYQPYRMHKILTGWHCK